MVLPDIRYYDGVFGNKETPILIILRETPRYASWGNRFPAENLLNECVDVGERLLATQSELAQYAYQYRKTADELFDSREPIKPDDSIYLRLSTRLGFRE